MKVKDIVVVKTHFFEFFTRKSDRLKYHDTIPVKEMTNNDIDNNDIDHITLLPKGKMFKE